METKSFFHSPLKMWVVGLLIVAAVVGGVSYQPDFLERLKGSVTGAGNLTADDGAQITIKKGFDRLNSVNTTNLALQDVIIRHPDFQTDSNGNLIITYTGAIHPTNLPIKKITIMLSKYSYGKDAAGNDDPQIDGETTVNPGQTNWSVSITIPKDQIQIIWPNTSQNDVKILVIVEYPDGTKNADGTPKIQDIFERYYLLERVAPTPQCKDGQDNDEDGKVDFKSDGSGDPGCESETDEKEAGEAEKITFRFKGETNAKFYFFGASDPSGIYNVAPFETVVPADFGFTAKFSINQGKFSAHLNGSCSGGTDNKVQEVTIQSGGGVDCKIVLKYWPDNTSNATLTTVLTATADQSKRVITTALPTIEDGSHATLPSALTLEKNPGSVGNLAIKIDSYDASTGKLTLKLEQGGRTASIQPIFRLASASLLAGGTQFWADVMPWNTARVFGFSNPLVVEDLGGGKYRVTLYGTFFFFDIKVGASVSDAGSSQFVSYTVKSPTSPTTPPPQGQPSPGKITVVKDTDPDSGDNFNFTISAPANPSPFILDNGQDDDAYADRLTFAPLPAQTYEIIEEPTMNGPIPGYTMKKILCTSNKRGPWEGNTTTRKATVDLQTGEDVSCTFTNETLAGTLVVKKEIEPDDNAQFPFEILEKGKQIDRFSLGDGGVYTKKLKPGTYGVKEQLFEGFYLESISCGNPSLGTGETTIEIKDKETLTCEFKNRQTRRLFVSHKTYAGGEINGIPGGNALCNALAAEGELGNEGKWAFLASAQAEQGKPAQNAKDVLQDGVTYVRINRNRWIPKDPKDNDDGLITLGTKQDLLTKGPARPVLRTPWGPQQQDRGMPYLYHQGNDGYPYTGSDAKGEVIPGKHCKSWTSSEKPDLGRKGHAHATGDWIDETDDGGCDQKKPIYCVETDEPVVTASSQVTVKDPGPTNPIPVGGTTGSTGGTGGAGGSSRLPPAFNPLTPTHIIPPNPVNGNVNVNVNGLTGIPSGKPPLPNGATSVSTFEVRSTQNLANGGLVIFRTAIPETVAKTALQKHNIQFSADVWATPNLATKLYTALKLYRFNEDSKQWEGCPGFAHVALPNIFEIGCKGTSIFTFAIEEPPPAAAVTPPATLPPAVTSTGGSGGGSSGGGGGGYAQTIESVISGAWTPPAPKAEETVTPESKQPEVVETKKSAAPKIVFSDVSAKSKYKAAIEKVASLGIMIGSPDPKDAKKRVFKEKNVVNRAELTTLLVRWLFPGMHGAPTERSACFFKDITKSAWFAETIFVGCEQGLVKGYSDKSFKPTAAMNYVEATKVIVEAAARKSPKTVGAVLLKELAASKKANEAWFAPYVRTAEKTKILGKDDLALVKKYPIGGATRGWVAQAIANIPEL